MIKILRPLRKTKETRLYIKMYGIFFSHSDVSYRLLTHGEAIYIVVFFIFSLE